MLWSTLSLESGYCGFRSIQRFIQGKVFGLVRSLHRMARLSFIGLLFLSPTSQSAGIGDFGGEPVRACYSYYTNVFLTEFYNYLLNQYFYAVPCFNDEAIITSGAAGPGWYKTGWEFGVWSWSSAGVFCRFYGSVWPGPNSHFFTSDPQECNALQLLPKGPPSQPRWNLETASAFAAIDLDAAGTGCKFSAGKKLVRRFFNNGPANGRDSNHRFVADDEVNLRNEMLRKGWVDEGVRFCVSGVYFNAVKRP